MTITLALPVCVLSRSVMSDSANPWTVAQQALLSMGILQARILKWIATPSSRGSSQPRDGICVSYISGAGRQVLYLYHHLGSPIWFYQVQTP